MEIPGGEVPCSGVVLATGVETAEITRWLGFRPNIYPVKGYSGTWSVTDTAGVPRLPFVDESELMAVATFDGVFRVTAIAEFARQDRSLRTEAIEKIDSYVRRSFGSALDLDAPVFWAGLRPTTPAGPPFLGRLKAADNLWINAGHGQLGWTMSAGAAKVLAASIAGEEPELQDVSSRAGWLSPL